MRRVIATMIVLGLVTACSEELRSAADPTSEDHACAGLPRAEVDQAMGELLANVEGVESLHDSSNSKVPPHLVGAVVQVRATRGMTSEYLGRVLQCHAAQRRAVACGSERSCALALEGANREVTTTPTGFAVTLRSRNAEVAREIERRARALASRSAPAGEALAGARGRGR